MPLKRYSTDELIHVFTDIFYDYMTENDPSSEFPTQVDVVHNDYLTRLNLYQSKVDMYENAIKRDDISKDKKESLSKTLNSIIKPAYDRLKNSNINYQKAIYAKGKTADYCRTTVSIPLDKKINSFYDDLVLDVLFYDDVCTLAGKYEEYTHLETREERERFLRENTEITHFALANYRNGMRQVMIQVMGDMNFDDIRVSLKGIHLLRAKFSDFEHLTLADTSEIDNNDLKQYIQSKIDLDKEDMKELAKINIRGDIYSIHQPKGSEDLYIRYTCRSTGRVYYNKLNTRNLALSSEFKEGKYDTYCKAWWNLNTLGGKVTGKPVIRC